MEKKAGPGEVQKWIHSGRPKWLGAQLAQAERPEVAADGRTLSFAIPLETWGVVVSVAGETDASKVSVLAVARGLGADAAPLLPVLQGPKTGKVPVDRWAPAWMVDSALSHIGTLVRTPAAE
jgi:hypothetical protein